MKVVYTIIQIAYHNFKQSGGMGRPGQLPYMETRLSAVTVTAEFLAVCMKMAVNLVFFVQASHFNLFRLLSY